MSLSTLESLKQQLFQTHPEYRSLVREHQRADARLQEILALPHPRPDELEESALLKRRKLYLKDRMEEIIRQHQVRATV
ncbi:MAG: DUF465 domain-containing protein [Chloracidobacterium sp.]|nr:DUF465 domain-containing protein [Chloracidobacterium sp.]MDW8218862.1 hypothetical protein [Acidobacteriota bacterium]